MRFRGIPKRNSVRLGTSNRFYSAMPMPGEYAASVTPSEYYPWNFTRAPDGGKPHYWWRKVKTFAAIASITVTDPSMGGFGTITIAGSGSSVRNFGSGSGFYGDERDTEFPTFHNHTFVLDSGPDHIEIQLRICGLAGEDADGGPANTPGPSFYVTATENAPQFWVRATFNRTGIVFPGADAASYALAGASTTTGSGTLDGNSFDLNSADVPGFTISAASIVIVPDVEYAWA